MAVVLLAVVTLWQRQRAVRLKLASRAALQAAHDSLESTVAARTAQLRAAQSDLVHAGKLAALGQMSAGMVHELNQPLTALRTLSDSAGILLDAAASRRSARQPAPHLRHGRPLARLTSQLKTLRTRAKRRWPPCRWHAASPMHTPSSAHELQATTSPFDADVQPLGLRVMADEAAMPVC
jgi:two-component system C4-dicarboxylate transport sensor histidine kinase DctB